MIKVAGCGGGGGNACNHMVEAQRMPTVEFYAINTDVQALQKSLVPEKNRIQIGELVTRGLGTGGNPMLGEESALESESKIRGALSGADLVFIAAGMGGGTGSGSAPIVARVARNLGALTVGVVTYPFSFEGRRRAAQADEAVQRLRKEVDALILIPNDKLMENATADTTVTQAFQMADSVLLQGVRGISEIITVGGLINVDFADVRSVMEGAGNAMLGIGYGKGTSRAKDAALNAISSPLLEGGIANATGIVYNITGGSDLSLFEVNTASEIIYELADPTANIIFGAVVDEGITDGSVHVTVVATGFDTDGLSRIAPKLASKPTSESATEPPPGQVPQFLRKRKKGWF